MPRYLEVSPTKFSGACLQVHIHRILLEESEQKGLFIIEICKKDFPIYEKNTEPENLFLISSPNQRKKYNFV